jgi:hypothetical protein
MPLQLLGGGPATERLVFHWNAKPVTFRKVSDEHIPLVSRAHARWSPAVHSAGVLAMLGLVCDGGRASLFRLITAMTALLQLDTAVALLQHDTAAALLQLDTAAALL